MTTSSFPGESGCSSDDPGMHQHLTPTEQVSEPGELIAAIPALLGFRPSDSVVALCLMGDSPATLGPVMRHDYFPPIGARPAPPMEAALRRFAQVSDGEGAAAIVLVIVADCTDSEAVIVADSADELLEGTGVELADVLCTSAIEPRRPWVSVLCPEHRGLVSDPGSSSVTAAQVVGGRVIRSSREELVQAVRGTARNQDRIAVLIELCRAQGDELDRLPDDARVRANVGLILHHVDSVASGRYPAPRDCAELALALADVRARDIALGLAVTTSAVAAEQVWLILTHELPDPERACPATLLGYFAYVRGDGPLAGVALSLALETDPEYTLAGLLDVSLHTGVRPDGIRDLAAVGLAVADAMGVIGIPPIAPETR